MFTKLCFKAPILTLLSIVWLYTSAYAQYKVKDNTVSNTAFLELNGAQLQQRSTLNRRLAFSKAKEKGWATLRVKKDGGIVILQGIDELGLPIYYTTYNNSIAAATTQTSALYSGGNLGLSLNGSSISSGKFAIWDGGAVLTNHIEFAGGRIEIKDGTTSTSTHATHVAGTIMAAGINPAARGMAYGLPKLYSFDFSDDTPEMSTNASTLLLSNHSYGSVAGWDYNEDVTPSRWEFYGLTGANEDFKFGYYDSEAAEWDKICFNAPYYLPVKSAGNNRNLNGPAVGAPYFRYNSTGSMVSAGNRPEGISNNDGYDIVPTYGNAKNIITVGAVSPLPNGPGNAAFIRIASFSSWGPTDDGRIKPDIVGDGINVTSTSDAATDAYTTLSGTSMAAPNISGSLVLLQELYAQRHGGNTYMRSATLKGIVLATATDAGTPGPDYIYGWGLLNAQAAAKCILDNGALSSIQERTINQGELQTLEVIASGSGPLVATICWTDPEGTVIPQNQALDNPGLKLVNDLDVRIIEGTTAYRPWILDPANPSATAVKGDNIRDNIEQVYLGDAIPGKTYKIQFSHKGTLQRGPQAYSLILTGIGGQAYCASKPLSTTDTKIIRFAVNNIDNRPVNGCTDYSDFRNLQINAEAGQTYPLTIETGTCGQLQAKSVRVFADWNGDGDFDDAGEVLFGQSLSAAQNTSQGTIQIPTTVSPGQISILRVIVSETDDPTSINACGNYGKGETQDYSLFFNGPSRDAGISAILNPISGVCAGAFQSVTVSVKNFGTSTLSDIPLTAIVSTGGNTVATLEGTVAAAGISPLEQREFTFPEGFSAISGKTYLITVRSNLSNDLNPSNDFVSTQVQVAVSPLVAAESEAYFCTTLKSYQLNSPGNGTIFWYKSATDLNPFAFGNQVITTESPIGNSYFAGLNDFKTTVGVTRKSLLRDGGYNQFTPDVNIRISMPVLLESARLYIGNSGRIKFTILNSAGVEVSGTTVDVTATRTLAAAGAVDNDPNDLGRRYALNLKFPSAGNYILHVDYLDGATLFRNNTGGTNYPYSSALDMFSITGNSVAAPNDAATFYYYIYELQVQPLGCMGISRIEVPIVKPTITNISNTLSVNLTGTYQWYLNGIAIAGATSAQYQPLANGTYTVDVLINTGCILRSDELLITAIPLKSANETLNLKIYPVPSQRDLTIEFTVSNPEHLKLSIVNVVGQRVYYESRDNYLGIYSSKPDLGKLPAGVYTVTITVGQQRYSRKIVLIR